MGIKELKSRYQSLFGIEGAQNDSILKVERALKLTLPNDFKAISEFYSGGDIGMVSHHSIDYPCDASNLVEETLRLRSQFKLKDNFIVVAEPAESIIILDTSSNSTNKVIWCDANDLSNLNEGKKISNQIDTWPSYADFFEYLITEEEEERGSE